MNQISHPDIEELAEYLEQPENNRWFSLREHIADCGECRKQVSLLQQSLKQFGNQVEDLFDKSHLQHLSENEISEYCASIGTDQINEKIEQHIKKCDTCRYRTLSYQHRKHTSTDEKEQQDDVTKNLQEVNIESVPAKFNLHHFMPKQVQSIAAVLVIAISAVLFPVIYLNSQSKFEQTNVIAAFANNPRLQMLEMEEGSRAFMGQNSQLGDKFKEPKFLIDEKSRLTVSWQKVENSTDYTIKVFSNENQMGKPIVMHKTQDTSAQFNNVLLNNNHMYFWEISGTIKNEESDKNTQFFIDGGFVMESLDIK